MIGKILLIALVITLVISAFLMLFLTKFYKKQYDAIPLEPGPEGWHDLKAEDEAAYQARKEAGELSWREENRDEREEFFKWS